jgi:hypothetical protein
MNPEEGSGRASQIGMAHLTIPYVKCGNKWDFSHIHNHIDVYY